MLLIFDIDRKLTVKSEGSSSPVSSITAKRGGEEEVLVKIQRNDTFITEEAADLLLKFVVKPVGEYDEDPLAATEAFAWDASSLAYRANISYVTVALNTLFNVDGNGANDIPFLTLGAEIGFKFDAGDEWKRSENNMTLTLRNNYLRDEDGTPSGLPGPIDFLDAHAVRYDAAQSLSSGQRKQARDNLGIHDFITLALSDLVSDLTTGTAKAYFRMPYAATITAVRASALTAPAGSTIIVDINDSGASILSTKLSIDAGEKTSTTAATPAVISDATIADDAEITIGIDQVGSGTPGKGLEVTIYFTKTNP